MTLTRGPPAIGDPVRPRYPGASSASGATCGVGCHGRIGSESLSSGAIGPLGHPGTKHLAPQDETSLVVIEKLQHRIVITRVLSDPGNQLGDIGSAVLVNLGAVWLGIDGERVRRGFVDPDECGMLRV